MHTIGDGHAQVAEATGDAPENEDESAAHEVADAIHSAVDADETDAGVHDGVLERFVDAGNREEICRIGDDEPGSGAGLSSDDTVTKQGSTQVGA